MARHNKFDLEGFCTAIENGDALAQRHFYADDAEVRLWSLETPDEAVRVLDGRAEVQDWIDDKYAQEDSTFQVVYQWIESDEVMVTEERHRLDGSRTLTASTAQIANGQIVKQSLVIVETSQPPNSEEP